MDTIIKNMASFGKVMSISNKQHLSNFLGSIDEKGKQHWSWVEKNRCL